MYKIRMIENDLELCKSIRNECLNRSFDFDYCTDLESGVAMLSSSRSEPDIVILDGMGFLKKGDTTENTAHIAKGISQVRNLYRTVSIAIYTAHLDIVKDHLEGVIEENVPILDKSIFNSPSLFLDEIVSLIENSDLRKLQNKYRDLFELFDRGYLLQETKVYSEFIDILKLLEEDSFESLNILQTKGYLVSLRSILEHIYIQIYDFYGELFRPEAHAVKDMNFELRGSKSHNTNYEPSTTEYQIDPIAKLVDAVYYNVGSYIHSINKGTDLFRSHYGLKALAFSLFEIMMWYKNAIETDIFNE